MTPLTVYRIASIENLPAALQSMPTAGRSFIALPGYTKEQFSALEAAGLNRLSDPAGLPDSTVMEREYLNLISEVGIKQPALRWWPVSLSEKNEHISLLYGELVDFIQFSKIIELCTGKENIVLLCGQVLADQIKFFCRDKGITFLDCEARALRHGRRFILWAKNALQPLLFCFGIWRRMYCVRRLPGKIIRNKLRSLTSKRTFVIRSFVDEQIGNYDICAYNHYFGCLPRFATERGFQPLIFARVLTGFKEIIKILKNNPKALIIPEEYFLRWSDPLACIIAAGKTLTLQVKGSFCGIDVSVLLKAELARSKYNLVTSRNLLAYYAGYRLASAIKFDRYIQTYENYAWEKMILLGLRAAGCRARLLGFQHAFVSRSSFKYFLSKEEQGLAPLPDKIITLGNRTKAILETYGNYPKNRLVVGCALRQEYLHQKPPVVRCRQKRLAVPLTMVPDECCRIVKFVLASGLNSDWQINFRCHPHLAMPGFYDGLKGVDLSCMTFDNSLPVYEELCRISVLAYTWSTVAAEALYLGVPVVHLNILKPLRADPLFECTGLKRTADDPLEMADAARKFYDMNDPDFDKESKSARSYLQEYFFPVTKENLNIFFET